MNFIFALILVLFLCLEILSLVNVYPLRSTKIASQCLKIVATRSSKLSSSDIDQRNLIFFAGYIENRCKVPLKLPILKIYAYSDIFAQHLVYEVTSFKVEERTIIHPYSRVHYEQTLEISSDELEKGLMYLVKMTD